MSNSLSPWPWLPLLFLLGGCQTLNLPNRSEAPDETSRPLPFERKVTPPAEMSPDLVYNYLAGEIGIQRGATRTTFEHLLAAAREAKDPVAAAQAARMALQMNDLDKAAEAARLWVEYDPNALAARQLATVLALRRGRKDEALEQAEAAIRIAEATGKDGFFELAGVLAGERRADKIELMRALAARHPDDPRAHYALALVASQRKRYDLAFQELERASRLKPQWDKPWLLHAQLLRLQGRVKEAEAGLRQAAREHPSATLWQALGRMLMQQKRHDDALEAFQKAARLDPENEELRTAIGLLAIETKKWELARETWLALTKSRNAARRQEAWFFLGQIEELRKRPERAAEYYRKITSGRFLQEARLRLAILTGQAGRLEEASRLFRELRLTHPHQAVQLYVTEAQLYKEQGHPQKAMALYDEAIAANPANPDLLYARGLLAADMGDVAQAERDLRKVLELQPEDPDALNALGYTLADQTDRLDEAFEYIRRALEKLPDSAPILDSMGWVLYRMGRREEALEYLQKAAAKLQDGEIAAHLGEVLWSLDRREEARRVWDEALRFDPDNPKLQETLRRFR